PRRLRSHAWKLIRIIPGEGARRGTSLPHTHTAESAMSRPVATATLEWLLGYEAAYPASPKDYDEAPRGVRIATPTVTLAGGGPSGCPAASRRSASTIRAAPRAAMCVTGAPASAQNGSPRGT